jgi:hypothetical protein
MAVNEDDTLSLFDEKEIVKKVPLQRKELKIVAAKSKPLSKDQKVFNRLTKRIGQLQTGIKADQKKLEALLKAYLAEMLGRKRSLAEVRLQIAKALGASTETIRFGKRQLEQVRAAILTLCDDAFGDVEPDKETEAFYDAWAETSYQEEARQQVEMIKREFADQARDAFGIHMNVEEMGDTPEAFARFVKRMQEQYESGQEDMPKKRKTKKHLARDEMKKQEEALALKSMRSIYLSLAKVLHPDTITDPVEKARKEEMMKNVTAAYAAHDLATLLKLELEWIRSENDTLDTLPDDQLKLYIASLKEQVEALEQERFALHMHPRFAGVSDFAPYPESYGISQIKETARGYGRIAKELREILAVLSRPGAKKETMAFVKEYLAESESIDPFDDEFIRGIFN